MEEIKIVKETVCPICSNSNGNFDGGLCDENGCSSLYGHEMINDEFIQSCSKIVKKRITEINKKVKDNSREYKQLELDMLKLVLKHIYKKEGSDFFCKRIKEKLQYWQDGYDTEIDDEYKHEYCKECGKRL